MADSSFRMMIVAGEASGDLYGARLAEEVRTVAPGASFIGMGGDRMRSAGVDTVVDANEMAVVGLVEVLAHFGTIVRAFRKLEAILKNDPPAVLVLIDYPDFNLRLAAKAKKLGVKVLYFISPQVWAWRAGRVHGISRVVDHMTVLFPFEVPYYERVNLPVTFVGHPLLDMVRPTMPRDAAFGALGLDPERPVVGLFPGSRRSEIRNLFGTILDSARVIREQNPQVQFVLPLAPSLRRDDIDAQLAAAGLPVTVVQEGSIYDVMQTCSAVVTVSGTVTMELALMGVPMVIIYRVSPFTYAVGKRLIKVDHIGICNIVAGERVVPELIQDEANPERIAAETARYLRDDAHAAAVRAKLQGVRERLGSGNALGQVASVALQLGGRGTA